jgi:serine/threonine protein kinase
VLPYELKVNIASHIAQGLYYLHEAEHSVIHRRLTSYCIFLDGQCNAKISGFGLNGFKVCLILVFDQQSTINYYTETHKAGYKLELLDCTRSSE